MYLKHRSFVLGQTNILVTIHNLSIRRHSDQVKQGIACKINSLTRLHSSRMRTARLLTQLPACSAGGGCACSRGVPAQGLCACSQGRGVGPGGVPAPGGLVPGVVSQHALRQTPPPMWTEFSTHTQGSHFSRLTKFPDFSSIFCHFSSIFLMFYFFKLKT